MIGPFRPLPAFVVLALLVSFAAPHARRVERAPADLPPNVSAGWWNQVQRRLAMAEYSLSARAGAYQAPNRAHGFRTDFTAEGIRVRPRSGGDGRPTWEWRMTLSDWGRVGGVSRRVESFPPRVTGNRAEYRREGISEWYVNDTRGLEQGFTIAESPGGQAGHLFVRLATSGTTRAVHDEDRQGVDFLSGQTSVIRFDHLHVWDARGRTLPAWFEPEDDSRFAIVVDDSRAAYPITIDPLATNPAWSLGIDQTGAGFGWSVATAGDVNGDGFGDVIVGARFYDNGQGNEGGAFVFLGSAAGLALTPAWTGEGNQPGAGYGEAVATAGDVNGDGYDDVIVGAFLMNAPDSDEGRAFVYHGSALGLSPTANWTAESDLAIAQFGASVASAGDVNGDGYGDVIVGAPQFFGGESDEGRAYVYHGSPSGLGPAAAWAVESNASGARFGESVSGAGDVNGDGFADVIVGAPHFVNGEPQEGRALVYLGSSTGLSAVASWTAESNQTQAQLGSSVAAAGDVNGDGHGDVIVGSPFYDNGPADVGRALLYYGNVGGLGAAPAWTVDGGQVSAQFGASVATAGDVNGDGFSDVLAGSPLLDAGEVDEGGAYLYLGSSSGPSLTPSWSAQGDQTSAQLGLSVASAGDVNGDGFSEVIVGAPNFDSGLTDEGAAFVYPGSPSGLSTGSEWTAEANQSGASLGFSVASAGDVNGDGYSDVIVGARSFDNGEVDEGRAFVYHGSAAGPATTPAWTAEGNQAGANFGRSVAGAGDVNGDGYGDVIVGADVYDNVQSNEGRAFVYHGSAAGLSASAAWTTESDQISAFYGYSVASAGDVNGDGYGDVIVGARVYDGDLTNEGRVYVYHGSASGLDPVVDWLQEGNQANAFFGTSVACAGDVNRDGYSDVIIGASGYDNGHLDEGRAYLHLGSPAGLDPTAAWSAEGDQPGADFGIAVAGAGDGDNDGYSDVIVGADLYDNGEVDEGRAFFYRGSPSGLNAAFSWSGEGNQAGAQYGFSVASAGDVDGDSYSEVIVGAPLYANVNPFEGRAWLYRGSAAALGPEPVAVWTTAGQLQGEQYGASVASAGDVNGDGFSDVIVGALGASNGQPGEGRAFLYYGNSGKGMDRAPRQLHTDGSTPIALLGASKSAHGFRVQLLGRTPAGRGDVRLQFEVKPLGTPFDGLGLTTGLATDTGTPGPGGSRVELMPQLAAQLLPNTVYHWRGRVLTGWAAAPRSPWVSPPGNAITEADLRTKMANVSVAPPDGDAAGLRIASAAPNPFRDAMELRYTLPSRGRVRLAIYDVAGREVQVLVDRVEGTGEHVARWRAPDDAAGVFFARLRLGDGSATVKLIRAR